MAKALVIEWCLVTFLTLSLFANNKYKCSSVQISVSGNNSRVSNLNLTSTIFPEILANRTKRVIGGEEAKSGEYPYQAFLCYNGVYICGGAVVSNRHVLSAAHCVCGLIDEAYDALTIAVGTTNMYNCKKGFTSTVRKVACHPKFLFGIENSWQYDLIVITLNDSIPFNEKQSSIALPTSDTAAQLSAVVTGWGRKSLQGLLSTSLQKLPVITMKNAECQKYYATPILHSQICALGKNDTGAYRGDSGSPLVSNGMLVGIFSWTMQGVTGFPGIYTRIYCSLSFIESAMQDGLAQPG